MATSKTQFDVEENIFTLKELSNECEGKYPAIVTVGTPDYEYLLGEDLSPGTELLICKPRCVEYCRIKILPFVDSKRVSETKGLDYVSERDKYNGREFLIPLEYPGKLQVVTDSGRKNRLTSVSQVLNDLPTYIKVCQMLHCDSPIDGKKQFIDADTTLEVKRVVNDPYEDRNHLVCKTNNNISIFLPEDCLINGKALFSLSSLVKSSKTLPQTVLFELVEADDVIMHDDDEASKLLLLMGGPISVLSVTSRNVYVAWMKKADGHASRKLAVLPEQVWHTVVVSLSEFYDNIERSEYIRETYGEYFGTEFVGSSLYKMLPIQDDIVYISEPRVENIDDYEEPIPSVPPRTAKPLEQKEEVILLPKHAKINRESKIKVFKRLSIGFDKVHKQLSQNFEEKTKPTNEKINNRKRRVTHEMFTLPVQKDDQPKEKESSYIELKNCTSKFDQSAKKQGKKLQSIVKPMIVVPSNNVSAEVNTTLKEQQNVDTDSKPDYSIEDFYNYTTDEVVECFQFCGLDTMARLCNENTLDGAFFKILSLKDIEECFDLGKIELRKVQRIMETGWRPKKT